MHGNDLYITIREAIEYAAEERGRTYDAEHEAHYMAMHVLTALRYAGYAVVKLPEAA